MEQNDAGSSDAAPPSPVEDERGGVTDPSTAPDATVSSVEGAGASATATALLSDAGEIDRSAGTPRAARESRDPVAVVALVLAILLLGVPAAVLAGWGVYRARSAGRRGGLARGVLVAAIVEIALGVFLTSLYFAVLAPVLTLPTT